MRHADILLCIPALTGGISTKFTTVSKHVSYLISQNEI